MLGAEAAGIRLSTRQPRRGRANGVGGSPEGASADPAWRKLLRARSAPPNRYLAASTPTRGKARQKQSVLAPATISGLGVRAPPGRAYGGARVYSGAAAFQRHVALLAGGGGSDLQASQAGGSRSGAGRAVLERLSTSSPSRCRSRRGRVVDVHGAARRHRLRPVATVHGDG